MSADDTTDADDVDDGAEHAVGGVTDGETEQGEVTADDRSRSEELTDRLSEGTDKAVEEFDQRLVDLLSWMLDTETRARIYVNLRQSPHSTSDEIAEGTGLYPSTVREALAELHDEGVVERRKRQSEGAGNNPYEYAAIAPSELVGTVAERVQSELNTVFNLDSHIRSDSEEPDPDDEPVTITVEDEDADTNSDATDAESSEEDAESATTADEADD